MVITPYLNLPITITRCSSCGELLRINQQAISFHAMAEHPLLLGECCTDKASDALIQEYSKALTDESPEWPTNWITESSEGRMTAVANASKVISEVYETAAAAPFLVEGAE